jgi:hypothetical protein
MSPALLRRAIVVLCFHRVRRGHRAAGGSSSSRSCTWATTCWSRTGRAKSSRHPRGGWTAAAAGIGQLWMGNPSLQTLEVYRLEAGRWVVVDTQGGDALARAEPFDAVELRLGRWWAP